jgi:hypothetical protein
MFPFEEVLIESGRTIGWGLANTGKIFYFIIMSEINI